MVFFSVFDGMSRVTTVAGSTKNTNEAKRNNAMGQLQAGESCLAAATVFDVSPSTIPRRDITIAREQHMTYPDPIDHLGPPEPKIITSTTSTKGMGDNSLLYSIQHPGFVQDTAQTAQNCLREARLQAIWPVCVINLTARYSQ